MTTHMGLFLGPGNSIFRLDERLCYRHNNVIIQLQIELEIALFIKLYFNCISVQ